MNSDPNNKINRDLFNAMIDIKNLGMSPNEQINSVGCSIKWK